MSGIRLLALATLCLAVLALPACGGGGGGKGLRVDSDPVLVTSTSIPPMLSGEVMDHVIPIEGGCGGPYVLKVIEGEMPDALELDNDTHAIVGGVLEAGDFEFTVQVIDTGCEPFLSTTATFQMEVGVGEITVVDATRDGNSVLIPPGGASYNPDYPSIGSVVYNEYATIEFVVAGGQGPYGATIFDDPDIPNDGPLPLGASIPPNSTSINGSPVEVGPDGGPFLVTVEITDRVGGKGYFTFYWVVATPAIVFATDDWDDGQTGVLFSRTIIVAEGVPPFEYEFVETGLPADYVSDSSDNPNPDPTAVVIYNPGAPPTVTPPEAMVKIDGSYYPAPSGAPVPGVPPEGALLNEETGTFSGYARRVGSFSVNAHVFSTLVPNSFGQHAWGTLYFAMTPPPALEQDPAYTQAPAFTDTKPYAPIAEANQGEVYNPDGTERGLQLLATGGVPYDGVTDAPHLSQQLEDTDEPPYGYKWDIDWNPDGDTEEPFGLVPGMELLEDGRFRIIEVGGVAQVDDLIPEFPQSIAFIVSDALLPTTIEPPAADRTEKLQFGVGPDRVLVTESSTGIANSNDNRNWDDTMMTVKYLIPGGVSTLRVPNQNDLTGTGTTRHELPSEAGASTTVDAMLTDVDLLRTSINPTTYWDDNTYLNPNAARGYQNSHRSYRYYAYGPGSSGSTSYSGYSSSYQGFNPSTACVRLPKCKDLDLLEDKDLGIYPDGGKFHVFDTATHFGVMIVRRDGKLYIPAAFERSSSGYYSFGDNWTYPHQAANRTNSTTRIPQMTVSPDGKIAALKLKRSSSYSWSEYAYTTPILLISLTGERIAAWGNEVYKIVGAGPTSSSSSYGRYLYASGLTLTNDHLYYIIGNQTSQAYHRDHYIYRFSLFGTASAGAFLQPSAPIPEWTQTAGTPMQVPFQQLTSFAYVSSTSSSNGSVYPFQVPGGYNAYEGGLAPHPFRVNTQGNACAILAGKNTTVSTSTSAAAAADVLLHHVWVDYEGSLHKLSTTPRHTSGGGRGIALKIGVTYSVSAMWGDQNGPTSRFEISDDGLKVAVVYYRNPTVDPYTDYNDTAYRYREDIAAFSTTNNWATTTVHEVTGDSTTKHGYYYASPSGSQAVGGRFPGGSAYNTDIVWRFGALTFTMDGQGLIFWGGFSAYDPDDYTLNSNRYESAKSMTGTLYSFDFSNSFGYVRNILSSSYGGSTRSPGSAYSTYVYTDSAWGTSHGVIKPVAGFRSQNGNFLYMATRGAVSTSSSYRRDGALIGVNVRSLNSSANINGKLDGRGFYVNGFGSRNGFLGSHYYYHAYGMGHYTSYSSLYANRYSWLGINDRVAALDNGWVYFTSVTASTSLYSIYSTSSTYQPRWGGPVRTTYGYGHAGYTKKLYVFDPNVGGNVHDVGGAGWSGSSQHVQGLVVSDDGTSLIEVGTTTSSTSYSYPDRQNLTVFSGIDLHTTTGALIGTPTRQKFESAKWTGDCATFSQRLDAVYYGVGSGATSMSLKKGDVDGSSTTSADLGLPTARWAVIHAGRK